MGVSIPGEPEHPVAMPAADEVVRARLIATQEAERMRIARDLHDVVGQALTAVRLNLVAMQRPKQTPVAAADLLKASLVSIDAALSQVRSAAFDLRPPMLDDLGLASALRTSCRGASTDDHSFVFASDLDNVRFPWETETACYRIAREAMVNVIRHAGPCSATVALGYRPRSHQLVLNIADNGLGFDPHVCESGCLGLAGMAERAAIVGGRVVVRSARGRGTTVTAIFATDPAGALP